MIGIFDSGVGGLSVFREIRKLLPEEFYIYYSDNANCPYGEKSREFIVDRARMISSELVERGADIIVVACNTATAAAITILRKEFSDRSNPHVRQRVKRLSKGRIDHVAFIGMEPAIKPAINMTRTGVIGVLATKGTLQGEKYKSSREHAFGKVTVVENVGDGFVELVENWELSGQHTENVVAKSLKPLLDKGADTIVLGCTHYPFLSDTIRKICGPDITIVDPAPAVARHLVNVMQEEGLASSGASYPTEKKNLAEQSGVAKKKNLTDSMDPSSKILLLASGSDKVLKYVFDKGF